MDKTESKKVYNNQSQNETKTHGKFLLKITLPYPPSLNQIYKPLGRRIILSPKAHGFKKMVNEIVRESGNDFYLTQRLEVVIVANPPSKRSDIDNTTKILFDAMEDAGVYVNDNQIDKYSVLRGKVEKEGGNIIVSIFEI